MGRYDTYICHADADSEVVVTNIEPRLKELGIGRVMLDYHNEVGEQKADVIVDNMENSWKVSLIQILGLS